MKEKPVLVEDMYEMRKKIRNCDREYNPFQKIKFQNIHTEKWHNASSANTSNLATRHHSAKRNRKIQKQASDQDLYKDDKTHLIQELEDFEIEQNKKYVKQKNVQPHSRESRSVNTNKIWDFMDNNKRDNSTNNQQTKNRLQQTAKKSAATIQERFQNYKTKIGQVRVRQSMFVNQNDFELENLIAESNQNNSFELRTGTLEDDLVFPKIVQESNKQSIQQINLVKSPVQQKSFDLKTRQTSTGSQERQRPKIYFPKLHKQSMSENSRESNNYKFNFQVSIHEGSKLHFKALKSLAINMNKKKMQIQNNTFLNFSDLWKIFEELKNPQELSREATKILQDCRVHMKRQQDIKATEAK